MTLSNLQSKRFQTPIAIVAACLLPWIFFNYGDIAKASQVKTFFVPVVAVIIAFFYRGLNVREPLWSREMDRIWTQISDQLLQMIPADLDVTVSEEKVLSDQYIRGKLTGLFWDNVDEDDRLKALKGHFYKAGLHYSTSIDAVTICGISSLCYLIYGVLSGQVQYLVTSAVLIVGVGLTWGLIVPRQRKEFEKLSREQLALLSKRRSSQVEDAFRELIVDWRGKGDLH